MKHLVTTLLVLVIITGCNTYKTIGFEEFKKDKRYELELANGQAVDGRYHRTVGDSVYLTVNASEVAFPKQQIVRIRRKKISTLSVVGGFALATAGIIAFIDYADKDQTVLDTVRE